MSRGSEIGFFEIQLHYLASSYGVCRRSLPDSARLTLEEALSLGIQHVFLKMNIGADEKQSKFTIMGLYHQNEQPTSEGFRIKTTSFMNYENVWDGPLDFQRECYKAIDKCRKLVKDMYPEKISFK
jgi:hypothetical protein